MSKAHARRFYAETGFEPAPDGGFRVTLDGRPAKTPNGAELKSPNQALAEAAAAEWAAQEGSIRPETMPVTGFLTTAIDHARAERAAVVDMIARYAENDMLCYRAGGPRELVRRQQAGWQPVLDWAKETLNAPLVTTADVAPIPQAEAAVAAIRRAVESLDDLTLTVLGTVTRVSGSVVLGLALVMGRLDAKAVADAAHLDERWQAGQWGEDAEAEARRRALSDEIAAAARVLALARDGRAPGNEAPGQGMC